LVVGRDIEKLRVGQARCWFAADWKWVIGGVINVVAEHIAPLAVGAKVAARNFR